MKSIKFLVLSLMIILGLKSVSMAQPTVLTGTTTRQASQLILWYDQAFFAGPLGRFTFIQVTNGSNEHGVNIHVQFFTNENPDFGNPATRTFCVQRDFDDFLTPNDTVVYDLFDIVRNGPPPGNTPVDFSVIDTKGFVVITAVDSDGEAVSHQHLFGASHVFDLNAAALHSTPAMGRDAVDFDIPFPITVVPDGTVLDGIDAGLVLIQPDVLKFNFESTLTKSPDFPNLADIISIAFIDDYDGRSGGGYAAEPGAVLWDTPLIFNLFEQPTSCDTVLQNCFFDIGLNEIFLSDGFPANPLLDGAKLLCPRNFTEDGWARVDVTGFDEFENELGLVAMTTSNDTGDSYWMHAEPPGVIPPSPTPTPTPTTEPSPTPTPTPACTDDDQCDEFEICVDGACIVGCRDNDECPQGDVCEFLNEDFGVCVPRSGDFASSGKCSTIAGAAPVNLGSALMSMLIPLLPAVGIAARSLRRRSKQANKNKS